MLLIVSPAIAAEPIVWKWAAADSARYQLTQTTKMTVNAGSAGTVANSSRQDTLIRWSVDGTPADGPTKLRQATERVVVKHTDSMGQGFAYDSSDEDPPAGMAALVAPMFEAMIENDMLLTMLGTGEITGVEMSEELAEAFERLPGGAVSGEMVTKMTKQNAVSFPAKPLEVGDQWTTVKEVETPQIGTMKVSTTYTYDGPREIEGRQFEAFTPVVAIERVGEGPSGVEATIETKEAVGELLFDREAGRLHTSSIAQIMEVRVKLGDKELVNEVQQSIAMRRLDEGEGLSLSEEAPEGSAVSDR